MILYLYSIIITVC